jgi:hypothetical protein
MLDSVHSSMKIPNSPEGIAKQMLGNQAWFI